MLRRLTAAAAVALCLAPATAFAGLDPVIKDCSDHGRLTKTYSQKQYRDALANIPTDVAEYTDCRDQIRRAQLGLGGGSGRGGGGAPGAPAGGPPADAGPIRDAYVGANATPQEKARAQKDVAAATSRGAGIQQIANADVQPGALAYHNFGAVSKLPAALVVLAALILIAALSAGAYLITTRVRTGRHAGA